MTIFYNTELHFCCSLTFLGTHSESSLQTIGYLFLPTPENGTHYNSLINIKWNHYLNALTQAKLALESSFPLQNIYKPSHQGYTNSVVLGCHPVEFRGEKTS